MTLTKLIQPEMTIEEILSQWPYTAALFKQYRLACVGCSLTPFCTVREMTVLYEVVEDEFVTKLEEMIEHHEQTK